MEEVARVEVLNPTAGLYIAPARGDDVLQPLRLCSIGERDGVSVWRREDVDRRPVHPVTLPSAVDDHPESRQVTRERRREVVRYPPVDTSNPTRNRHGTRLPDLLKGLSMGEP